MHSMHLIVLENSCTFPKHVSADPRVRYAAKEAEKALAELSVESGMRKDVYAVLKRVASKLDKSKTGGLTQEEGRYVDKMLQAYEQAGPHRPGKGLPPWVTPTSQRPE